LGIGVVAVTALMTGQALRRQWQAARLKTDLAAAVSHELRTPLASMRLLVDNLLEEDTPDAKKTREYLELIARENARLSRLIENFLTFSRLERNRQRFEFRPTQVERVVRDAVEAVQGRFAVDVDIAEGLSAVSADEGALVTALLNLLDNADKYGGGKWVGLKVFGETGRVVFCVEDQGIGIAMGERKKIFRRFYQVDQRLARETGGCGLGLSIVDYIVRAHGGTVNVESEVGRGSRFSVTLPCG
jgi:signal transduction histidine kinase